MIRPNLKVTSIRDIQFTLLKDQHGIEAVCFDKDNCLTLPDRPEIHDPPALEDCVRVFGHDRVAILSNTAGYREERMAQALEKISGVRVIRHLARKPFCDAELQAHFGNLQVAMVGDRWLTDVYQAHRMGYFSILVDPIDRKQEGLGVRIARFIEEVLFT